MSALADYVEAYQKAGTTTERSVWILQSWMADNGLTWNDDGHFVKALGEAERTGGGLAGELATGCRYMINANFAGL